MRYTHIESRNRIKIPVDDKEAISNILYKINDTPHIEYINDVLYVTNYEISKKNEHYIEVEALTIVFESGDI